MAGRILPLAALALAGAGIGCGGDGAPRATAATPATGGRSFATRIPGPGGIENFAKVADGLYRGAQPSEEGLRGLRDLGVRTVVNLREHHSEKEEAERLGLAPVEIPIRAGVLGSEPPADDDVRRFFEVVLDPKRRPVYVHCAKGKDRTGTMVALYRIEVEGWTPEEAIAEMQEFGYHDVYKDLIAFVRRYDPRGFRPPAAGR